MPLFFSANVLNVIVEKPDLRQYAAQIYLFICI